MYVEVDKTLEGRLFISILTNSPGARGYNIRITQVRICLSKINIWNFNIKLLFCASPAQGQFRT